MLKSRVCQAHEGVKLQIVWITVIICKVGEQHFIKTLEIFRMKQKIMGTCTAASRLNKKQTNSPGNNTITLRSRANIY